MSQPMQPLYQAPMRPTKSNLALCVALASMLSRTTFAQAPVDGDGAKREIVQGNAEPALSAAEASSA